MVKWLTKWLKVWGAVFETDLPPEFVITTHARKRINERMGCSDDLKIKRLAVKAWHSSNHFRPATQIKENVAEYYWRDYQYRELMGKIFVFAYGRNNRRGLPPSKVLITVI